MNLLQTRPYALQHDDGPERLASCSEAMTTAARYQIEILGPLPE